MEIKRRQIEEEIGDIEQFHPEFGLKRKFDSSFSPLSSCDLAEDLLSSKHLSENASLDSTFIPLIYL